MGLWMILYILSILLTSFTNCDWFFFFVCFLFSVSSGSDDPPPPPKPSRYPGVISTESIPSNNNNTTQTYIVAQNPEVLVHLLRENQSRGVDPSVYTIQASPFNTLAVDFQPINPNLLPNDSHSSVADKTPSHSTHSSFVDHNKAFDSPSRLTANKSLPRNFGGGSLAKFPEASLVSVLSGSSRDVTRRRSSTPSLKDATGRCDGPPDKVWAPVDILHCMLRF